MHSRKFASVIFVSAAIAATAIDCDAANIIFDGGADGTGTDIGTALNWSGDVLPAPGTPDVGLFDGTVAGGLALSYSGGIAG
ncbi:MAG: hypothetical protein ABIT37_00960, partial [Luteolibacter sp.]